MTKLNLDHTRLLGFRIDSAAGVKIGSKPGSRAATTDPSKGKPNDRLTLDHSKLLGFRIDGAAGPKIATGRDQGRRQRIHRKVTQ